MTVKMKFGVIAAGLSLLLWFGASAMSAASAAVHKAQATQQAEMTQLGIN